MKTAAIVPRIALARRVRVAVLWALTLNGARVEAQSSCADTSCSSRSERCIDEVSARPSIAPSLRVGMGALLLSAIAMDAPLRDAAARHQRAGLDRLANAIDPLGRAGVLVPALVASVVVPRVLGKRALSEHAARVALGYAMSDGVESILKPIVGRHRPSDGGGPWRFAPMRNDADWHSFPSAHTVHAFSIAIGVALESKASAVTAPAYALASGVGLQRVYTRAHWSSDAVASAALAMEVSTRTNGWLREHGIGRLLPAVDRCASSRF